MVALVAEVRPALPSTPVVVFEGPIEVAVDQTSADELVVVFREALSNVARHAEASRIEVTLVADDSTVTLTVEDDGVGPPPEPPDHGSGLRNMASRAERLGGSFELVRRAGAGACQRWSVPRRG